MVFPHRMGIPFKRALKNLMAEYLKKIIQDDGTHVLSFIHVVFSAIFYSCNVVT